jgi:hypothetical protein
MNNRISGFLAFPIWEIFLITVSNAQLKPDAGKPGSMVFISPELRLLFSGDAVGTQSSKGGLWLQLPGCLYVDEYQAVLKGFIAGTAGQYEGILTGHNAAPVGPQYLDCLVLAAQKVINMGDAALIPSVRPAGIKMVVYGEDNDPFAASINVNPNHVLSGKKRSE